MRTTGWLLASASALCVGVWLVVSGWAQPRPSVSQAVRHLRRPTELASTGGDRRLTARVGETLRRSELGVRTDRWMQPLRLIGRPVDEHLGLLVIAATTGFVLPALVLGILQATGVVAIGAWIPLGLSLATAALLPILVHSDAMARSAEIAVDLRHQLGAYLDMVTMLLAGNSGYEGALDQAARAGDGLLFVELRRRMREVSTTGHSLVGALDLVAADYGLVELEQVAATATLSAAEGAPVARSLNAKCATLRSTLAAEQEAAARIRNDKVTPPLVGMALLFMALIIYPALNLN
jgi:tight adherence protein C